MFFCFTVRNKYSNGKITCAVWVLNTQWRIMARFVFSAFLMLFGLQGFSQQASNAARSSPSDDVNVRIGTAAGGQTFPATGVPFGMTQWTPQTREGEAKCIAPYYASDSRIQGFRGSHFLSGSCAQDYGSFTVMPLPTNAKLGAVAQASSFNRDSEVARPYLYAVDLAESGIHAEITGSERSGMMRFRYANGEKVGWLSVENNVRLGCGVITVDSRVHRFEQRAGRWALGETTQRPP
jgi:putative alpha-1,2-mannosidase